MVNVCLNVTVPQCAGKSMYRSRHVNTPNNSYPKDCQRACVPLTDLLFKGTAGDHKGPPRHSSPPSPLRERARGGRRATIKALPATPHHPRPYGKGLAAYCAQQVLLHTFDVPVDRETLPHGCLRGL